VYTLRASCSVTVSTEDDESDESMSDVNSAVSTVVEKCSRFTSALLYVMLDKPLKENDNFTVDNEGNVRGLYDKFVDFCCYFVISLLMIIKLQKNITNMRLP